MTPVPVLAQTWEEDVSMEQSEALADSGPTAPTAPIKRPRRPRPKPEHRTVMRADTLASPLTASKARAIEVLFAAWSRCAVALGHEQWRATAVAFSA